MSVQFTVETRRLVRRHPFTISRGTSLEGKAILVRAQSNGMSGFGSATPNSVTGETLEGMASAARTLMLSVPVSDPSLALNAVPTWGGAAGNPALTAAFEAALLDLAGKVRGKPVCDIVGKARDDVAYTVSVGVDPILVALDRAGEALAGGARALKVKVDADWRAGIGRIEAIRARHPDVELYVDANEALDLESAKAFARSAEALGVLALEQPLKRGDGQIKELAASTSIPLYADESVKNPDDLHGLEGFAGVNIKHLKCGGVARSVELAKGASAMGLRVMTGCYFESALSVAAGLHATLCMPDVVVGDLDSSLRLKEDFASGGFTTGAGRMRPTGGPGLDVAVSEARG